jgi:superfamily II DNA or RNA helicase
MKSLSLLNEKQLAAVDHIYEYGETFIIGDMGSGKTVVVLAAINDLLKDGHVKRVLIFSTPKICKTVWKQDAAEWEELAHLAPVMAVCTGSTSAAERQAAVENPDNKILLVTFDLAPWFFQTFKHAHGCDMLVIDESTKIAAGGKQFKAMRSYLRDFHTRVITTGTPVEERWQNVFYQVMVCDNGASLGRSKSLFLSEFFYPLDYQGYKWELRLGGDKSIFAKIKHLICTLPDYRHELPLLTIELNYIELNQQARDYYEAFKHDMVDNKRDIEAPNAGVLGEKLRQIANGFIYRTNEEDQRQVFYVHNLKQKALAHVLHKATEKKVIIAWNFKEELKRALKILPVNSYIELDPKNVEQSIEHWKDTLGCKYLIMHPKSASHGLRLEKATLLVLLSPIWSRDGWLQLIARMHRRGQFKRCRAVVLVAKNTVDEKELSVIEDKAENTKLLKQHLKGV